MPAVEGEENSFMIFLFEKSLKKRQNQNNNKMEEKQSSLLDSTENKTFLMKVNFIIENKNK